MSESHPLVLLIQIEVLVPYARSLKDKRAAVKGLKDRIRSRFNASVAEVGYLDKWQRALLGVALVGSERRHLESEAGRLQQVCEEARDLQLIGTTKDWL